MKTFFVTCLILQIFTFTQSNHMIPLANGTLINLTDQQVADFIDQDENARLFSYNPRRDVNFILQYFPPGSTIKIRQKIPIDDDDALAKSKFNSSFPTKILVHGWNAGNPEAAVDVPANAFLKQNQSYNVIEVDWRKGSNTFNYISAKLRDNPTGQIVAEFITFLVTKGGAVYEDFELIGFSLGAHVVGFAGKHLNGVIPVIVGLEPAGPLYFSIDAKGRLNRGDAKFVEIMHTCAGRLGYEEPIGDVDYYANGGKGQVGCGIDWNGSCSHARAWVYFAEGINSATGFWGRKCRDYSSIKSNGCKNYEEPRRLFAQKPHDAQDLIRGVYYFKTNKKEPYAVGYQ